MKPAKPIPPEQLEALRRTVLQNGWLLRPGTGGGVFVAEHGGCHKYAADRGGARDGAAETSLDFRQLKAHCRSAIAVSRGLPEPAY